MRTWKRAGMGHKASRQVGMWLERIGLKGFVYGRHTRGHSQGKARQGDLNYQITNGVVRGQLMRQRAWTRHVFGASSPAGSMIELEEGSRQARFLGRPWAETETTSQRRTELSVERLQAQLTSQKHPEEGKASGSGPDFEKHEVTL